MNIFRHYFYSLRTSYYIFWTYSHPLLSPIIFYPASRSSSSIFTSIEISLCCPASRHVIDLPGVTVSKTDDCPSPSVCPVPLETQLVVGFMPTTCTIYAGVLSVWSCTGLTSAVTVVVSSCRQLPCCVGETKAVFLILSAVLSLTVVLTCLCEDHGLGSQ